MGGDPQPRVIIASALVIWATGIRYARAGMPGGANDEAICARIAAMDLDSLRPSVRAHLLDTFAHWFAPAHATSRVRDRSFEGFLALAESSLADAPELASLALDLAAPTSHPDVRRWGCILATSFPSLETVRAMESITLDASAPDALRAQACWTLGFRALELRTDAVRWDAATVRAADAALGRALDAGLARLPLVQAALRSVDDPDVHARLAVLEPELASRCVAAFASPSLARRLLDAIETLPAERAALMPRLAAAALGPEIAPALLALADRATIAIAHEARFAALALDPDRAGPAVDAYVGSLAFPGDVAARRDFHRARPGEHAVIEALRVALTSATLAPSERPARCARAARALLEARAAHAVPDDLSRFLRHLAFRGRSEAPDLLVAALGERDDALSDEPELVEPFLVALAESGRFSALAARSVALGRGDLGAWLLASSARPLHALATRLRTPSEGERALAAEALALFLVGRVDLAARTFEAFTPEAAPVWRSIASSRDFPGPEERWLAARDGDAARRIDAVVRKDPAGLLACLRPTAPGAEPDSFDFSVLTRFEAPRGLWLEGARVLVDRRVPDASVLRDALRARGAILVDAPFPGTAFHVVSDEVDPDLAFRLWRIGSRPLPLARLGLG